MKIGMMEEKGQADAMSEGILQEKTSANEIRQSDINLYNLFSAQEGMGDI